VPLKATKIMVTNLQDCHREPILMLTRLF